MPTFPIFVVKWGNRQLILTSLKILYLVKLSKEAVHRACILPTLVYCSQVWRHCGERNTSKLKKVNERALRQLFSGKSASEN